MDYQILFAIYFYHIQVVLLNFDCLYHRSLVLNYYHLTCYWGKINNLWFVFCYSKDFRKDDKQIGEVHIHKYVIHIILYAQIKPPIMFCI